MLLTSLSGVESRPWMLAMIWLRFSLENMSTVCAQDSITMMSCGNMIACGFFGLDYTCLGSLRALLQFMPHQVPPISSGVSRMETSGRKGYGPFPT